MIKAPLNLSILNSMKLWHNKESKESRKGCKSTFFKTSGESWKSVKGGMGTRKTNLTVAFQFFKIWLRTYHSDILVSTVKVLHFTKTDFNWVLCYVFNPNESSIILFTSPQVLWRHKDYWRLGKLALKKKQNYLKLTTK